MAELTNERLVAAYSKIKAEHDAFMSSVNEIEDAYKAKLKRIQQELLKRLNAQKMDSFQAGGMTVYRHKELIPTASDWNAVYNFIVEEGAWDIMERRLKKTFVADYMARNKNTLPPGVSVMQEFVAKVRRNPQKKEKVTADE